MAQPDFSPSAERNKQPILETLQTFLPAQGTALEIASGTGQHVVWLAQHMPLWPRHQPANNALTVTLRHVTR